MYTLIALLCTAAGQVLPLQFLFPEDLEDARGLRLEAQKPEDEVALIPQDNQRPSLWYLPVASEQTQDGARIWYQRIDKDETDYSDQRTLCVGSYGRSNGWTIPALAPAPPAWGGPNNVVLRRSPYKPTWGGFNVFQIVHIRGPYRMLYWDQPKDGAAGAMLASSVDGLAWTKDVRGTVFTEHNDAFTLLAVNSGFLLYQTALADWPDKPHQDNLANKRRVQSIRESDDLVQWTPQQIVLQPDQNDEPRTEFYMMKAFPYGHGYGAVLLKYYADPSAPGRHSAIYKMELMVSRDARNWLRIFRETDLGFWTYAEPFTFQGKLCFPISKNGVMTLVRYHPEKLVAVAADAEEGEFVTRPFTIPASDLGIHADARNGYIDVEVLDAAKTPLTFDSCRIAQVQGEKIPLTWDDFYSSELPLTECRLRFHIRNARLYAVTVLGN